MVFNVPEIANSKKNDSFPLRRAAVEKGVTVMTCMDTAKAFLRAVKLKQEEAKLQYNRLF